jgi:hypothetical protein
MRCPSWTSLAGLSVLLLGSFVVVAPGNSYAPRQYYGGWNKGSNYYYRSYYYKPTPSYYGYKYHQARYYGYHYNKPAYKNNYYYYNTYTKKLWGRCPTHAYVNEYYGDHKDDYYYGKQSYSLLKEEDRKGNISDIKEEAFPPPKKMPPIPESKDGATMDLPPDELPQNTTKGVPINEGK